MSFEEWFENWWLEHERDVFAPTPKEALLQAWLAGRKAEKASQHRLHTDACPECQGRGWIPNGEPDDCDACNGTGKRG